MSAPYRDRDVPPDTEETPSFRFGVAAWKQVALNLGIGAVLGALLAVDYGVWGFLLTFGVYMASAVVLALASRVSAWHAARAERAVLDAVAKVEVEYKSRVGDEPLAKLRVAESDAVAEGRGAARAEEPRAEEPRAEQPPAEQPPAEQEEAEPLRADERGVKPSHAE